MTMANGIMCCTHENRYTLTEVEKPPPARTSQDRRHSEQKVVERCR